MKTVSEAAVVERASARAELQLRKIATFRLLLLTLATSLFAFAEPRLTLSKKFPGSIPEFSEVRIERDGHVEYREAPDEDPPLRIKLSSEDTDAIFALSEKCDHFRRPLESGLKVARMGEKMFRWEDGAESHEVKFNYTQDEPGQALQDWYERIVESERAFFDLQRTAKYDHLGVNQSLLELEAAYENKRLVAVEQFLSLLDRIAKNEIYMHMARERAAQLADRFRGVPAPKASQ
jgi:hypothetical protein